MAISDTLYSLEYSVLWNIVMVVQGISGTQKKSQLMMKNKALAPKFFFMMMFLPFVHQ
jgi:hypothetical protein